MIINCFGKDAEALSELKSIFMQSLTKLAKEGKNIDFNSVYKDVLFTLDIDIESAAYMYQEVKADAYAMDSDISSHMTSEAELDKIASDANMDSVFKKNSKDTPAMALSKKILSFIRDTGHDTKDVDRVKKVISDYAKSIVKGRKTGKVVDILAEALDRDMKGTGFGMSYDDFFASLKKELEGTLSKVKDPVVRKGLESQIQKIIKAGFKMGITESGRKKILYNAIKESKYGKTIIKEGKDYRVVDWNAIAMEEDPIKALHSVLSDKLDSLGFKGDKKRVYEALKDEIEDIRRARSYAKAITAMDIEGTTVIKKLADEVAIARGLYKVVDGKKVADYRKYENKEFKEAGAGASILDALEREMIAAGLKYNKGDHEKNIRLLVNTYIKKKDISQIRGSILKLMKNNNKPFKVKIGEIDRLSKLRNIAGLDGSTSVLAGKILNMPIDASIMAKLDSLVRQYQELMSYTDMTKEDLKALFPWISDFNQDYSPAMFASTASQVIVRDMANLVRAANLTGKSRLPRTMEFILRWQMTVLANTLTNLPNIIQNTFSGILGANVAGPDIVAKGKKVHGINRSRIKELADTAKIYFTNDYTGEGVHVRGAAADNIYNTEGFDKVIAGISMMSTGILSAIDGIAQVNGVSRSFYKGLSSDLRVKLEAAGEPNVQKKIDDILYSYFSAEYQEKALSLAKHFLSKVGVTEASIGTKRYYRILEAEAENVRRSFFMSGPISEYINPERVHSIKKNAERLTEMQLGRKDFHVIEGGKKKYLQNAGIFGYNRAASAIDQLTEWYNRSFSDYLKEKTYFNAWSFLMKGGLFAFIKGGPLAFMSGATRWADIALGSAINMPVYLLTNKVGRAKNKYKESIGGGKNEAGKQFNEQDIMAAYEEYEIARRRMHLSMVAWGVSAAILTLALAAGEGSDDDDSFWEGLWKDVKDGFSDFDQSPAGELILRRIVPLQIRLLYGMSNLRRKWTDGTGWVDNLTKMAPLLYTQVPMNVESLATRYYRQGDNAADVGAKITKEFVGSAFSLAPIFNFGGWAGITNPIRDALAGSRKRVDYANHAFLGDPEYGENFWEGASSGIMWGLTGYAAGYAADGMGIMRTTGMEILPEDYNKKFSQIDWSKYENSKYNESKQEVEALLPRLDAVAVEIERIADNLDIPEFKKAGAGARAYERYYDGIFIVSAKGLNLSELKTKYGVEPTEKGNINILRAALNKMGLKKINISDAEIAIKWKNLQEKLGK